MGAILILGGGFAIADFGGLFGIGAIDTVPSVLFSLFVYIVVVNSVNLIDGIDTLAGGYGLLASIAGAVWFQFTGQTDLAILCKALAGALAGFIVFNISPARIFLGDSGSLILGMFIYVIAVGVMSTPAEQVPSLWDHRSMPVLAMTLLELPVGGHPAGVHPAGARKVPLLPRPEHIHHLMIELGMTHLQAALTIHLYTGMVGLGFVMPAMDATQAFFILLGCRLLSPGRPAHRRTVLPARRRGQRGPTLLISGRWAATFVAWAVLPPSASLAVPALGTTRLHRRPCHRPSGFR